MTLLLLSYEVLVAGLVYVLLTALGRCQTKPFSRASLGVTALFCLYLDLLSSVTGLPILYDMVFLSEGYINIIPFSHTVNGVGYVLNVLLFVPLGILVPLAWEKYRGLKQTVMIGFAFSLFVEVVQLFNYRISDIDDLIMNGLGTGLGYGFYLLLAKRFKPLSCSPFFTPQIYFFAIFLGRFFLLNDVSLIREG